MNFNSKFNIEDASIQSLSSLNSIYGSFEYPISLYKSPPTDGSISPQDLIDIAIARLEVLQLIASRQGLDENIIGATNAYSSELIKTLDKNELKINSNNSNPSPQQLSYISLRDQISHFIVKLAFASNSIHQDWFFLQEARLLSFKFERFQQYCQKMPYLLDEFLKDQGIQINKIEKPKNYDSFEKINLWNLCTEFKTNNVPHLYMMDIFQNSDIFKLIRARDIYIKNKVAYIAPDDFPSIIISRFKAEIYTSFSLFEDRKLKMKDMILIDPRISTLLNQLPNILTTGNDFSKPTRLSEEYKLELSSIAKIWMSSFPPCMQRLYKQLKKDHHLRHWGRQQFWLFLKGSGLTMDESLQFNRNLWSDPAAFDKEFRYNLRHQYGQEGKRVNKPPYTCSKIINGGIPNPGSGEYHGCPFKTMDLDVLKKFLIEMGVKTSSLSSIGDLVNTHQYQLACVRVFVDKHSDSQGEGVGNHPNAYYLESRRYLSNKSVIISSSK